MGTAWPPSRATRTPRQILHALDLLRDPGRAPPRHCQESHGVTLPEHHLEIRPHVRTVLVSHWYRPIHTIFSTHATAEEPLQMTTSPPITPVGPCPITRRRTISPMYSLQFLPFPVCSRADTSTRPQNQERPPEKPAVYRRRQVYANDTWRGRGRSWLRCPSGKAETDRAFDRAHPPRLRTGPRRRPAAHHKGGSDRDPLDQPSARSAARGDRTALSFLAGCGRRAFAHPPAARLDRAGPSRRGPGTNAGRDCPVAPPSGAGVSVGSAPRSRRAADQWHARSRARPRRLETAARRPRRSPPPSTPARSQLWRSARTGMMRSFPPFSRSRSAPSTKSPRCSASVAPMRAAGVAERPEHRPIAQAHEHRGIERRQQRPRLRDGDLRRPPLDHLIPVVGDRRERD